MSLWTIVGNCPPYFVEDDGTMSGTEALVDYCFWLESWSRFLSGKGQQPTFPLLTTGGKSVVEDPHSMAKPLKKLRAVIATEILPKYYELDQLGLNLAQEAR